MASLAAPASINFRNLSSDFYHKISGNSTTSGFGSWHGCTAAKCILRLRCCGSLAIASRSLLCPDGRQCRFNNTVNKNRGLLVCMAAKATDAKEGKQSSSLSWTKEENVAEEEEEEEADGEVSWLKEKAEDVVEFTQAVADAIPGPRVGNTEMPWLVAIPLAFLGISFVVAVIRTIRKFNSPLEKRRRLVNKNSLLCKTLDGLFQSKKAGLNHADLQRLVNKTGFTMEEIFRKYIRYALNEKPFDANLVSDLIHLRNSSMLDDAQVSEVLNEISRRIVKDKGPVVLSTAGFTEEGIKRKVAVQSLFNKVLYLSELEEFCPTAQNLLQVKRIFGVAEDDVDAFRIQIFSGVPDFESSEITEEPSDSHSKDNLEESDKNEEQK